MFDDLFVKTTRIQRFIVPRQTSHKSAVFVVAIGAVQDFVLAFEN
jgi:hypothetical protein